MLYLVDGKYYIKTAPLKYTEVSFSIKNDNVVIIPTQNKFEANAKAVITGVDFQKEKDKIKKSLELKNDNDDIEMIYKKRNKR